MTREMTRAERKATHGRVVASLLLADTRSERHGVYAKRASQKRTRRYTVPVVHENLPL